MGNIKAYIKSCNGIPTDDWGYAAYIGFSQKQVNIIFYEDIEEVPATKFNIVVGPIEDTISYWKRIGVETPPALNIPYSLNAHTGRKWMEMSMAYLRMYSFGALPEKGFFIKSKELKKFIPGLVRNSGELGMFFKDVPDETVLIISDIVDFVSEYRCFIIDGEIKGVKHYLGDMLVFPDGKVIKDMVKDYHDAPIAYSLDVGVLSNGQTVLVECNDGWSLGNYGLDGTTYTNLLTKRWFEITKNAIK